MLALSLRERRGLKQGPVQEASGLHCTRPRGSLFYPPPVDPGMAMCDACLVDFLLQASRTHPGLEALFPLCSPLPSGLFPLALGLTSSRPLLSLQAPTSWPMS